MNNTEYARVLQATLDAFPASNRRREANSRKVLRAALDALNAGASPEEALQAAQRSLGSPFPTPAAPWTFSPQKAPETPREAK